MAAAVTAGLRLRSLFGCVLALLLSAAVTGAASPADDRLSPLQPGPQTAAADPSVGGGDVNPNNIFGIACAEGLAMVNGRCAHTDAERSLPPLPLPPAQDTEADAEASTEDYDDFLSALGPIPDPEPPANDGRAAPPVALPGSDVINLSTSQFVDSLSNPEFLEELLRDSGEEETSPGPGCTSCRLGGVLVIVGSVFLALSLLLAVWAGVRWRRHQTAATVTV